jgi:hypothetical protein
LIGLVIVPSNIRNEMVANASRADGLATAETPLIRNAWYVVAASDRTSTASCKAQVAAFSEDQFAIEQS